MRVLLTLSVAAALGAAVPSVLAADLPADTGVAQQMVAEVDRTQGIEGLLAPGTKVPKIGPAASVLAYVRWAQASLDRGQLAEAELSLEWAQARRRIDEEENAMLFAIPMPTYDAACERVLCQAMRSIGAGDASAGRRHLAAALRAFEHEGGRPADFADPGLGSSAASLALGIRGSASASTLADAE